MTWTLLWGTIIKETYREKPVVHIYSSLSSLSEFQDKSESILCGNQHN